MVPSHQERFTFAIRSHAATPRTEHDYYIFHELLPGEHDWILHPLPHFCIRHDVPR